jgi:hypothetical protein
VVPPADLVATPLAEAARVARDRDCPSMLRRRTRNLRHALDSLLVGRQAPAMPVARGRSVFCHQGYCVYRSLDGVTLWSPRAAFANELIELVAHINHTPAIVFAR